MPSLASLNETSEWAQHEFRVMARANNLLVKTAGVESLFSHRSGALKAICSTFDGAHLMVRSYPDMLVRTPKRSWVIEAKAAESETPNLSIELCQFHFLWGSTQLFGEVAYLFGFPDRSDKLAGTVVPVLDIKPFQLHIPDRVYREWPIEQQRRLKECANRLEWAFPDMVLKDGTGTKGSGDPFLLVRKSEVLEPAGKSIRCWFDEHGPGNYSKQDRISWEGREEANQVWKSYTRSEWRRCHAIAA